MTWLKRYETAEEKSGTDCLSNLYLHYSEVVKEVRSALKNGYGITGIVNDEFHHFIVLLKYKPKSNCIFTIILRGTKEEIEELQKDPDIKQSALSN